MPLKRCCLFVLGLVAYAQASVSAEIGVGLNVYNFDYQEELVAPAKSSESGLLSTVTGDLVVPAPGLGEKSYFEIDGEFALDSSTEYAGTTLSTNLPITATDKNSIYRFETNAFISVTDSLFFHLGYGYRYWKRYLTYGSGYKEVYTWAYIPVGILVSMEMTPDFKIGIDCSYRVMLDGKIQVIFTETVTGGENTTLDLGNKPGYRVSFPMDFRSRGVRKYQIKPWLEHSEIGQSNSAYNSTPTGSGSALGYIQEPSSKTDQYGVMASVWIPF